MAKPAEPEIPEAPATRALARAIRRFAQTDGDHKTDIPALTLHRRSAPSEPLHCIYNLGLGLDEPALVPRLAPLIQQEITIRLLTGPHGPQLRRLATAGSPSQQIAKAVAWLKQNFVEASMGTTWRIART